MKILYLIDQPNLYGSELHVLKLLDAFKNTDEVSLVSFGQGPLLGVLEEKGIKFKVINLTWYSIVKAKNLYEFVKSQEFDIIHAHQPKAMLWGTIIAKLTGTPSLITVHSLPTSNIQSYKNFFAKVIVGVFHYGVKAISEYLASRIIYLSEFSVKSSLFTKKTEVIPNWVDEIIPDCEIKDFYNTPKQFISIGSVTVNKGMDRLIEAMALIADENWELKIIGDYKDDFKEKLLSIAVAAGISERIFFLGYKSNVKEFLLSSDAFILLSRGETFGLVYIEAMNCGLPVISWDIPVISEILPQGNLIMSDLGDIKGMFKLFYSSHEAFRRVSEKNRLHVKVNYGLKNIYLKYRALYDQILSNHTY